MGTIVSPNKILLSWVGPWGTSGKQGPLMDLARSGGWVKKALEALGLGFRRILGGFGKLLEGPERARRCLGILKSSWKPWRPRQRLPPCTFVFGSNTFLGNGLLPSSTKLSRSQICLQTGPLTSQTAPRRIKPAKVLRQSIYGTLEGELAWRPTQQGLLRWVSLSDRPAPANPKD